LKTRLRDELSAAPWVNAVELAALRGRAAPDERLSSILARERDALGQVYSLAGSPDWIWAVERLAHAPIVAVAGFQTERGVAAFLTHNLRYVRPNVRLVDVEGGHFADALKDSQETFLIVIETRRYSRQAKLLLSEAEALDLPALVLTDLFCPWASADNRRVLRVETDVGMVWPSMVALMATVSLLLHDAVLALGPEVSARLDWISRSYQSFVGHQSVARTSNS
jgi:DNA-binding MurR/RpiR family transcriptional regulator